MANDSPTPVSRSFLAGTAFVLPWLLGFMALVLFPFVASLYWSFCQYDMVNPPKFVGTQNYERLADEIARGEGFGRAAYNTFYYSVLSVPLSVAIGLVLAKFLSWPVRGQAFYRTLFFLPSVIPVVAASILWVWLLDPQDGMINYLLSSVGLGDQNWLKQSRAALSTETWSATTASLSNQDPLRIFGSKDALVMMTVWGMGNWIVIYLAAMNDVPTTLYESADMDGLSGVRKFWHITLPMLSPVIFFNLVMGLIRSVQAFTSIYILSEGTGAPNESLNVISLHLFLSAFSDLDMGYASAIAWILFLVLSVCTLLLFRSSRYWVHYRAAA